VIVRRIVVPLVCAYAVFLAAAIASLRRPAPRLRTGDGAIRPGLLRHVATTVLGGYAAFLLVVLVFHVLIAGQRGAFRNALWGGGFLAIVAAGAFVLLSILARVVGGRRGGMMDA